MEQEARKRRVRDFGQMPLQLFVDPHPKPNSKKEKAQKEKEKDSK